MVKSRVKHRGDCDEDGRGPSQPGADALAGLVARARCGSGPAPQPGVADSRGLRLGFGLVGAGAASSPALVRGFVSDRSGVLLLWLPGHFEPGLFARAAAQLCLVRDYSGFP